MQLSQPVDVPIKQIGKASIIYALGDFLSRGAKFLLIPFYVRYLAQAEVGVLALAQAVSTVVATLCSVGLAGATTRFYVEYESESEADAYVASIWWIQFLFAGFGCVLLVCFSFSVGERIFTQISGFYLSLAVIAGFLNSSWDIPLGRFVIREEPLKYRTVTFLEFLTTTLVIIYLVAGRGLGILGVLWGQVIGYGIWTAIAAIVISRVAKPRLVWPQLFESVRFSLPIVPHRLFQWGVSLSDRLILERFVPLASLGIYNVGYQLATVQSAFSSAMNQAWVPRFFRSATSGHGHKSYGRFATYFSVVVFSIALVLVVFGSTDLLTVLTTPAYREAGVIMRLVVVAYVCHAFYLLSVAPLFYKKKTQWIAVITGMAAAVNITFNLVFVPSYGIVAAALATVLAYFTMAAVAHVLARQFYKARFEYRRICVAGVVALLLGAIGVPASSGSVLMSIITKGFLLSLYPALLFVMPGFLSRGEQSGIIEAVRMLSQHPITATVVHSCRKFSELGRWTEMKMFHLVQYLLRSLKGQ